MSNILIVFASHYGQTRLIAQRIATRLRELGHDVDLANASDGVARVPPPQDYEAVVLGSRVELGKHASCVLDYIREHREDLRRIPTAFFSVSMSAADKHSDTDPHHYLEKTFASLGWAPTEKVAFAGGLPYRRYSWFMRLVMKQISKKAGHTTDTSKNHSFTSFTEVCEFADRFAWYLDERGTHSVGRG